MLKLLSLFLCLLLLPGCSSSESGEPQPYRAEVDGQQISVSFGELTLDQGSIQTPQGTYFFEYASDGSLQLTYPNGFVGILQEVNGAYASSWPYEQTPEELGYLSMLSMDWALEDAMASRSADNIRPGEILTGFILLALAAWLLLRPRDLWFLAWGWRYKDVQPSDLVLLLYRLLGALLGLWGLVRLIG